MASGRTKMSTSSPVAGARPTADAASRVRPLSVETLIPAASAASTLPRQRFVSPTNPATKGVWGR